MVAGTDEATVEASHEPDRCRLDAADWREPVGPFASLGQRFTVQANDAGLERIVVSMFADLLEGGTSDTFEATDANLARFQVLAPRHDRSGLVARDGSRVEQGSSAVRLLASLIWAVNRWVLDHASHSRVLLHAGGVADEDGRAVLLPAPSESGKSTLTAALVSRGLHYLSDEAVEVLPDGRCRGYAKPLSIDPGAFDLLPDLRAHVAGADLDEEFLTRQWHIPASRVTSVARAARIVAVVFPTYDSSASTVLSGVSPSEAMVLATGSTFAPNNGARVERWQVERLALGLHGVPCYRLVSSDLNEAAGLVTEMLAGST